MFSFVEPISKKHYCDVPDEGIHMFVEFFPHSNHFNNVQPSHFTRRKPIIYNQFLQFKNIVCN
jgi:hypothetical protein